MLLVYPVPAHMQGRTVDFKNTLIIMTSNVGSSVIEKGGGGLGFQLDQNEEDSSYNRIKTLVNEELKQYFRPEFLNRYALWLASPLAQD
jgi:ATP-dependent Clp protease ATP-binding subunit ClpC